MSTDFCVHILNKRLEKAKAKIPTNPEYEVVAENIAYDIYRAEKSLIENGEVDDGVRIIAAIDAISSALATLKVVEDRSPLDEVVCDIQDAFDIIGGCDASAKEVRLRLKEKAEEVNLFEGEED